MNKLFEKRTPEEILQHNKDHLRILVKRYVEDKKRNDGSEDLWVYKICRMLYDSWNDPAIVEFHDEILRLINP